MDPTSWSRDAEWIASLVALLGLAWRAGSTLTHLADKIDAAHRRLDGIKEDLKNIATESETRDNNLAARIVEIHESLVSADIIVPMNGGPLVARRRG